MAWPWLDEIKKHFCLFYVDFFGGNLGLWCNEPLKAFCFQFYLFIMILVLAVAILIGFLIKQDASRAHVGEEQGQSNVNVMCRLCFFGENEGSEKARRMLPCKKCGKKYHRSCLKSWAQHRGKI